MKYRIDTPGMFSARRKLKMDAFVGFDASDGDNRIDAGIIVLLLPYAMAQAFITFNGSLVQGMGGYISGLVETDPIRR